MLDPDPDEMNADPQPCLLKSFLIHGLFAIALPVRRGSLKVQGGFDGNVQFYQSLLNFQPPDDIGNNLINIWTYY
jgi:hypothetical protein